jgi:hypothetical protein
MLKRDEHYSYIGYDPEMPCYVCDKRIRECVKEFQDATVCDSCYDKQVLCECYECRTSESPCYGDCKDHECLGCRERKIEAAEMRFECGMDR